VALLIVAAGSGGFAELLVEVKDARVRQGGAGCRGEADEVALWIRPLFSAMLLVQFWKS
jgi:hypothetical protein